MITVIVPVYNKEKYIMRTLLSLKNQTQKDFEILIIDDCSTDSSYAKIKEFCDKNEDLNVKILKNKTNRGVSYSRNRGVLSAKNPYVVFLDADDTLDTCAIELYKKKIYDYESDYIVSNFKIKSEDETLYANSRKLFQKCNDLPKDYLKLVVKFHTNGWCINRKFLKDNGIFFDEQLDWGEDILFFSKVLLSSNNYQKIDIPLSTHYRDVRNSLSKDNLNKIEKDILWVNKLISYVEQTQNSTDIIEILEHYRLPGLITYRLLSVNSKKAYQYYLKNQKTVLNVKMVNGFRSIKLIFFTMLLKIKMRFTSLIIKNRVI